MTSRVQLRLADHGNRTLSIKQSWLNVLRDPTSDNWSKRWFDLKRPYLYMYESSNSSGLIGVINVSSVRVETSPEMVAVVGRPDTFAIYTAQVRVGTCPIVKLSTDFCGTELLFPAGFLPTGHGFVDARLRPRLWRLKIPNTTSISQNKQSSRYLSFKQQQQSFESNKNSRSKS